MSFKVLIPRAVATEGVEYLREHECEVDVYEEMSTEELKAVVGDYNAVLLRTDIMDRETIRMARQLKIIARHGIGFDNIDIEAATAEGIYVAYTPAANINSVAEHVVGLILAVSRHIVKVDKAVRQGDFGIRDTLLGTEMKGKTLGIIGLGNIGKLVAKKCALGFDMKVIAYDPYAASPVETYINKIEKIEELIAQADFVSLHLPYNKALHHFIGKEMLDSMKPTAFLINAARGGLVDEMALAEALRTKTIAGAALDVFEKEPVASNHPLLTLENLVVTPHQAAATKEAMSAMSLESAKEIVRVKNRQEPLMWVNRKQMSNMNS